MYVCQRDGQHGCFELACFSKEESSDVYMPETKQLSISQKLRYSSIRGSKGKMKIRWVLGRQLVSYNKTKK